jgi:uncharacterized protein (DUF697 family)
MSHGVLEPRFSTAILAWRRIFMANLLGALIGAAIDREDGDSGIKGAIVGTVAESAIRALAPIVATYALGWAVQYGIRKGWHALIGEDPVDQDGRLKARAA